GSFSPCLSCCAWARGVRMEVVFFSSRRRHTRCYRDWSSDVCSSDLNGATNVRTGPEKVGTALGFARVTLACMRIDAHQHFWHYDAQRDAWITDEMRVLRRDFLPEELSRELASNGMDASVAVQADQSENETFFLLELAAQHSTVAGVVGWVCLTAPDVAARLARPARFEKIRGVRRIAESMADDQSLLRPGCTRGIASLIQHQTTYD